jgi:predicted nicotinamide N-methyase
VGNDARRPLSERFSLEPMPVGIGGKRLEIFGIGNWDRFVDALAQKGEAYLKTFPFWIKFWEASFVLADDLVRRALPRESEVLEIGAGMGLAGLFLGAFGHRVTITDFDADVLELLQLNVDHNRLDTVTVRHLDWLSPNLDGAFDVICGSEVVYQERFFEPLLSLFQRYLKPGGEIYLAHNLHHDCGVKFLGLLKDRYEMESRIKSFRGDGKAHRIVIHTLRSG